MKTATMEFKIRSGRRPACRITGRPRPVKGAGREWDQAAGCRPIRPAGRPPLPGRAIRAEGIRLVRGLNAWLFHGRGVLGLLMVLGSLLAGGAVQAQSSRNSVPGVQDYERFSRFITSRNIFDPNRYPHETGTYIRHTYRPPSVRSPAFSFVGAMRYNKGVFAFFDGNSSEYRKALQVMDTNKIAGFTVKDIQLDSVTLVSDNQTNVLQVGYEMRLGNDNAWVMTGESQGFGDNSASSSSSSSGSAPNSSSSSSTSTSSGESSPASTPGAPVSDVLKRLMQLRQQETK